VRTRISTIAFRLLILTAVWLLGTATVTLAQETTTTAPAAVGQATEADEAEQPDQPLVVPDVRGLPYVFAKGVLEEAGFAWKVKGKVEGFAVNLVKAQSVKPGTRVVDTGAPRIVLTLVKNPSYEERGLPRNTAPYAGTKLLLASGAESTPAEAPPVGTGDHESAAPPADDAQDDAFAAEPAATTAESESGVEPSQPEPSLDPAETAEVQASGTPDEPAEPDDAGDPETEDDAPVAVKPKAASAKPKAAAPAKPKAATSAKPKAAPAVKRPPAFVEPGAPPEPLDEIPLPLRAKRLQAHMAKAGSLTDELLDHWRYQHAWIVTGAEFGWWHGAEALRILIKVDEAMQRRWNVAYRSEEIARATLAEVLAKAKAK
jgi:hypothetical protein